MDHSVRWRAIKSRSTQSVLTTGVSLNRDDLGEYRLWQRRFWEHTLRDDRNFASHVDYCHWHLVKQGLVNHLTDWPGGQKPGAETDYGERF